MSFFCQKIVEGAEKWPIFLYINHIMRLQNAATSHNTEPIATSKCGHVTTGLCAAVETLELDHK